MSGKIETKIFFGYLQTYAIKKQLEESTLWKEALLTGQAQLTQTESNHQHYIGFFLPSPLPYASLDTHTKKIESLMHLYFPSLNLDRLEPLFFPDIFLT